MANFLDRLNKYFEVESEKLRLEAEKASTFDNTSDIGLHRELAFLDFLKRHIPSNSDIFLGGFLFNEKGEESKQIDVIISHNTVPKFDFLINGKSFSQIDGCLGIVSIKSKLSKKELENSLINIASIPDKKEIADCTPCFNIQDSYEDFPYKIIYASDGIQCKTIIEHMNNYYTSNRIEWYKRPNIIYVRGKYVILRDAGVKTDGKPEKIHQYSTFDIERNWNPDLIAFATILNTLQQYAASANHIKFNFNEMYSMLLKKYLQILRTAV